MTAEEIQKLRTRAREDRQPLLREFEKLERPALIERLMQEPLPDRLYWYGHFSKSNAPKAERERLVRGETDDDVVDAQIILTKVNGATQRAAQRSYGYRGFETGPEEEILTEMIEKSGGAPFTILFHAYERMLFWYR